MERMEFRRNGISDRKACPKKPSESRKDGIADYVTIIKCLFNMPFLQNSFFYSWSLVLSEMASLRDLMSLTPYATLTPGPSPLKGEG